MSKPAPGEQQERQRDLGDHERRPHALRLHATGRAFRALLQRRAHVRPRNLQRRDKPEM
jgi:hypothetical protein